MAKPTTYDNSPLPWVPVIRIFGDSSKNGKTCVHIHQVFPYLLVEYTGSLHAKTVNSYIPRLKDSLNLAIAITFKKNTNSKAERSQYVRKVVLVKAIHFYGFHCRYSPFLKIYLADPQHIQRAVTILQAGSIMATSYRVYESHLSYILQFMVDFGLYGCGLLDLGEVYQRGHGYGGETDSTFLRSTQTRQSSCPFEVDVVAGEILNRRLLQQRHMHHAINVRSSVQPHEPLVPSVRELWEDERNRRAAKGLNPSPEIPMDPSASTRGEGGDWMSEVHWWDQLRDRMEAENTNPGNLGDTRDKTPDWERWAPTLFESIEVIWEEKYRVWKPGPPRTDSQTIPLLEPEDTTPKNLLPEVDDEILSGPVMTEIASQSQKDEYEPLQDIVPDEDNVGSFLDEEVPQEPVDDDSDDDMYERTPSPNQESWLKRKRERQTALAFAPAAHSIGTQGGSLVMEASSNDPPKKRRRVTFADDTEIEKAPLLSQESESSHNFPLSQPTGGSQSFNSSAYDSLNPYSLSQSQVSTASSSSSSQPLAPIFPQSQPESYYLYEYAIPPPSRQYCIDTYESYGFPTKVYREPHYSNPKDFPKKKKKDKGGVAIHLSRDGYDALKPWHDASAALVGEPRVVVDKLKRISEISIPGNTWEYAGSAPPSRRKAIEWLKSKEGIEQTRKAREEGEVTKFSFSQIEGPTQPKYQASPMVLDNSLRQKATMTSLALEIFVPTRKKLAPDPGMDAIAAVFYAFQESEDGPPKTGIVALMAAGLYQLKDIEHASADDEFDLINQVINLVVDLDPDILTGWEIQKSSWGYMNKRGETHHLDFLEQIGRAPSRRRKWFDQYGDRHSTTIEVTGRHVLNLWRIVRTDHNFTLYTFEKCVHELLRKRVPRYSYETLTTWFSSSYLYNIVTVIQHMNKRVLLVLEILEATDVVTKTAEFARVFGVDFFSVISRGSQFKVESFISRIAKPENLALLSPSKEQVGGQNAAECQPLVMEPLSAFYNSPLVVLDFQSLYPSIMIAYNICYSTCLGRVSEFQGKHKFGVTELELKPGLLEKLKDHIHVTPNGVMYVKPEVRQGLLGRMLIELLDTRVMVKTGMKAAGDNKTLRRILNARQLGLKYIANVTYGYTSATFSGRMPAVEIADSIVQCGRETLEQAISFIESEPKWNAKVVYGDTDSVFIYLPGKSKEQAFKIGYDIAAQVTARNPAPIKLKFEKVYHPCILLAKKRYVGFRYENIDDVEPEFDAKGIETVRRDGVPAQSKMVERCLKILFRTQDLSQIKAYCQDSWEKVQDERTSVQDFIFAKEVKLGTYSQSTVPQPGVMIAAKKQAKDQHAEALYGDRVPYVIIRHPDHRRLVEKAVDPVDFVADPSMHIDATYYIERVLIPPLDRILKLVGADVAQWYKDMPKKQRSLSRVTFHSPSKRNLRTVKKVHIDDHFRSVKCILCGKKTPQGGVCKKCVAKPQISIPILNRRIGEYQHKYSDSHQFCCSCTNRPLVEEVQCMAVNCPWMFARKKAEQSVDMCDDLQELVETLKWKIQL